MSIAEIEPEVVDRVRQRLADRPGDLSPHRVAEALRAAGSPVGDATVLAVYEALRRDVLGAGPLEPLLRQPGVTDVLVN
jgi:pilus assembly protein CpaF